MHHGVSEEILIFDKTNKTQRLEVYGGNLGEIITWKCLGGKEKIIGEILDTHLLKKIPNFIHAKKQHRILRIYQRIKGC